ncbi:hypothetical protein Agub_g8843 [Astrephomene gubernaculifera]|uniref:Phytanoyl-CoA dioxygenase n=1 Tax=Astrephomene gubernaculifera TaxID=47775 RepID=A0AAD3HNF0_9CHLO|nr:hypothetical protein Agub_g8843 [Astrephomene gubernaculifera]
MNVFPRNFDKHVRGQPCSRMDGLRVYCNQFPATHPFEKGGGFDYAAASTMRRPSTSVNPKCSPRSHLPDRAYKATWNFAHNSSCLPTLCTSAANARPSAACSASPATPALSTAPQPASAHRDPSSKARPFHANKSSPSSHTTLSDSALLRYEREGFLVTRQLLQTQQVEALKGSCEAEVAARRLDSLRHRVRVLCPGINPATLATEAAARAALAAQATDDLGFLQFFNLHRSNEDVARVALGPELAAVAAQLLGARRVRVYQDCLFLKEPGFAETNWHSDLRMAPLDTNQLVTAWIPLRPIGGAAGGAGSSSGDGGGRKRKKAQQAAGDSGLIFATGSHRDFALPFWHDMEGRDLSDRGYPIKDTGPMQVGDVSWHHGWTLHCAAPQPPGTPPRLALTVAFFADGARLLSRRSDPSLRPELLHDEDAESYAAWLPALTAGAGGGGGGSKGGQRVDGAVARHRLLPVVWPLQASEAGDFPLTSA